MRICANHWEMCWNSVKDHGLGDLVNKGPEVDAATIMQNDIVENPAQFDPLISMHWHFTNQALKYGGAYLLGPDMEGNPHCPICEFEQHSKGFEAKQEIDNVAVQMAVWARSVSLIPPIS